MGRSWEILGLKLTNTGVLRAWAPEPDQQVDHQKGYQPRKNGLVEVTCWCEENTIKLPVEYVGLFTLPCGAAFCVEPRELWA